MSATIPKLDVRTLSAPERHPRVFAMLDQLAPGEELLLVNDHEPKPLQYQIQATQPGCFAWESHQTGAREWTVRIRRLQQSPPLGELRLPARLPHFSPLLTVGKLLRRYPIALPVLARYGIIPHADDPRSLRDLAVEENVDLPTLMAALETALAR